MTTKNWTQTDTWTEAFRTAERELVDSGRKFWLVTLGAFATVGEAAGGVVDELIVRGRKLEDTGREGLERTRSEMESAKEEIGDRVESGVEEALERLGVPTRKQVDDLTVRIDRLSAKLTKMFG